MKENKLINKEVTPIKMYQVAFLFNLCVHILN